MGAAGRRLRGVPADGGRGHQRRGPFPTRVGLNFDELLQALGVPDGSNAADAANGILPPGYPAGWTAATLRP